MSWKTTDMYKMSQDFVATERALKWKDVVHFIPVPREWYKESTFRVNDNDQELIGVVYLSRDTSWVHRHTVLLKFHSQWWTTRHPEFWWLPSWLPVQASKACLTPKHQNVATSNLIYNNDHRNLNAQLSGNILSLNKTVWILDCQWSGKLS